MKGGEIHIRIMDGWNHVLCSDLNFNKGASNFPSPILASLLSAFFSASRLVWCIEKSLSHNKPYLKFSVPVFLAWFIQKKGWRLEIKLLLTPRRKDETRLKRKTQIDRLVDPTESCRDRSGKNLGSQMLELDLSLDSNFFAKSEKAATSWWTAGNWLREFLGSEFSLRTWIRAAGAMFFPELNEADVKWWNRLEKLWLTY